MFSAFGRACRVVLILVPLLSGLNGAGPQGDMKLIRGSSFDMGSSEAEIQTAMTRYGISHRDVFDPEVPQHQVSLQSYYIDAHEVTNEEFKRFTDANPEWRKSNLQPGLQNGQYLQDWRDNDYPEGKARFPVVYVTWHAAEAFCEWRGKRLPTEAEWEFAARGGLKDAEFPWGDELPGSGRANYSAEGHGQAIQVESYPPNSHGLFDMAGNVWEYCLDEWQPDFYQHSPSTAPLAGKWPANRQELLNVSGRRVIRGGSWSGAPVNLRVTYRDSHPADGAGNHVGFRCACDGPGKP